MHIKELFQKPVDRQSTVSSRPTTQRNLQTEVEEYVFTRDVIRGLGIFTDRYLNELTANGVWISGFFGSGKSHLLKMLSLALDETPASERRAGGDILLPKIDDEIVRADFKKCARDAVAQRPLQHRPEVRRDRR
jgi:hypothetical protein